MVVSGFFCKEALKFFGLKYLHGRVGGQDAKDRISIFFEGFCMIDYINEI